MAQEMEQAQQRQGGAGEWRAPDVIPTFSYEDAPAAIEWLEEAFGFGRHMVVAGQAGGSTTRSFGLGRG